MANSDLSARTRFLYLDDIPTPYRVTAYNQFQRSFPGEFKVIYAAEGEKGRHWVLPDHHYDFQVLPGFSWEPPCLSSPFPVKFNPSVINALRQWRPNVVAFSGYIHPTMLTAMMWAFINEVPYGIACESSLLSSRTRATFRLKKLLLGKLIRGARFGLATGSKAKEYLMSFGLDEARIYFFPNAPSVGYVQKKIHELTADNTLVQELKKRYSLSDNFVLFVGRMLAVKQPSDLLKAWLLLPEELRERHELVFCGSGPLGADIARFAEEHHLAKIRLLNDVPYDYLLCLMAFARVLVLPSIYEPWGAVINEALSAGTPAICSSAVGAAYDMVVEGKTGWKYPAGDTAQLAAAISRSLQLSHDEYKKMQGNCRELAARWDGETAAVNLMRAVTAARG